MYPPPRIDDPAAIAMLREALDRAPYTSGSIRDALVSGDEILSRNRDIPVHLRRLRDRGEFGALVRLFVLNVEVSMDEAQAALAPLTLERAATMGIIAASDGRISPLLRLVPHDDLIIASDLRLLPGEPMPHDHVPGVHRPSVTLAHLTVRRRVARALDLGTGCGVEALLLARHAGVVVGSDVNARALAFAAFNGHLNRVANVEWRLGSWFAPIGDMRFGVIACNPPYVISPETQYIYRDSGMRGDSVSEQVVREVAAHLDEGAFGTVTVSWVADPKDDDAAPVRKWVQGTGCDAWILHYRTEDPLTTAKSWNEQDATDAAEYAATLDRWLAYYEGLGIRAIAYGAVIMRRRSDGTNWVRTDPLPAGRLSPAGAHILRVFAAEDAFAKASDDALLASRLRVVPRAVLARTRSFADRAETITLSLDEGLGFQAEIDEHVVRVLSRLDGRTLRDALAAAAKDAGLDDAQRARFVEAGPRLARRLLATGLIEPVSV